MRTGGQGQPTLIHTQRPTQLPFQHRNIHKKLLKHSFSHFSTRGHGPTDGWSNGGTSQSTSDTGSEYGRRRLGRGIQPPSTPQAPPPTLIPKKNLKCSFSNFQLMGYGRTDGRTDGRSDRRTDGRTKPLIVACPQLKKIRRFVSIEVQRVVI